LIIANIKKTKQIAPSDVSSNNAIKKEFKDSVRNCLNAKFLEKAQWFQQMHIHQHKDKSYTLDQHHYILNTL
jgi:hypothetical protein